MPKYLSRDFHLSVLQKLPQFDTCNLVKSYSKHCKPQKYHQKNVRTLTGGSIEPPYALSDWIITLHILVLTKHKSKK